MLRTVLTLASLSLAALKTTAQTAPLPEGQAYPAPSAEIFQINGSRGQLIGEVKLTQGPRGVLMEIDIRAGGLTPGWHGIHLHQVGDCSDPGSYTLSGGHVGKIEGGHGLLNPDGPEAGDLPNIHADGAGRVKAEMFTTLVTLAQGPSAILDEDGTALIIHENRDDHISQPIGGAGGRVACAVIR